MIYHCALCLRVWWAFPSFIIRISRSRVPDWPRPSLMWNHKTTTTTCDTPRRLTTIVCAKHMRVLRVEQAFLTMMWEWWDNIFDNILSENQNASALSPPTSPFLLFTKTFTLGEVGPRKLQEKHIKQAVFNHLIYMKLLPVHHSLAYMHPEVFP